jgi:hypothetical protein
VTELLQQALDAHGGLDTWRSAEQVRVRLRSGGRMFDVRLQGRTIAGATRTGAVVRFSTDAPAAIFEGFPRPGHRGYFENGSVRIESHAGDPTLRRADARQAFSKLRHKLSWDTLDALYFVGYALWNYVCTPFMLTRPGFDLRDGEDWREGSETWRRLHVIFPPDVPTHSRQQTFYFDQHGLLRRLDYTAEVFSRWARAANYCFHYREMSGIMVPTRRRVTLRGPGGRALSGPTMVWIEIDEFELVPRSRADDARRGPGA